jgi:geranylgeranyl pyrophosphate synthase
MAFVLGQAKDLGYLNKVQITEYKASVAMIAWKTFVLIEKAPTASTMFLL